MAYNMKTLLLFSIGLLLSQMIYSQEIAPADMVFCPQGSFKTSRSINGESTTVTITVDPFWMSNEVTNRELNKPEKSTNYIGFRIVRSYLKE
jgi:hypothetical protein